MGMQRPSGIPVSNIMEAIHDRPAYLCIPDCIRNKHNDRCTFGILSF